MKKKNENNILSLPYGHHKHWGAPFAADIALGWYEWITVGAHIDILALGKKNQKIRINTAPSHRGLIKLTKSCALVNPGILWRLGAYIKADHVIHGFSLRTGYSCAYKGTDKIYPLEKEFDSTIANNDESLKKWYMHTIHAALEYDFTKEYQVLGPRVGLFINIPISGKRIFKTTISGFSGGLEITM